MIEYLAAMKLGSQAEAKLLLVSQKMKISHGSTEASLQMR